MMSYLSILFNNTKLVIFSEVSKKNFKVVYAEDAAVADFPALAGGKYLDVPPASIERVTERNDVTQFQDRAVGFPYGNIDRVAGVEHRASGRYMYRASHYEKVGLKFWLKMPGVVGISTDGVLSAKRHVNLTLLSFSSVSENSQV